MPWLTYRSAVLDTTMASGRAVLHGADVAHNNNNGGGVVGRQMMNRPFILRSLWRRTTHQKCYYLQMLSWVAALLR